MSAELILEINMIKAVNILLTSTIASTFTKQSSSVFKVKLNWRFLPALSREQSE